jgi:hypothetical protein
MLRLVWLPCKYSLSFEKAYSYLKASSPAAFGKSLQDLTSERKRFLATSIAKVALEFVNGFHKLVDETADIPPVVPLQLIDSSLTLLKFQSIMDSHKTRLQLRNVVHYDLVYQQFQAMILKARTDLTFVERVKATNASLSSFSEAWDVVGGDYSQLRQFCADLACVFPNTASVESEFSVMKAEKDSHRMRLTDLSLEGVLHSKQYLRLKNL